MKKMATVYTLIIKESFAKAFLCIFFVMLTLSGVVAQTTFTSTATGGPWNVGSTWVGGVVPGTNDDVVIAAGATVTVPSTQTCRLLTVNGNLTMTGTGITLNITNNSTSTDGLTMGAGSTVFIGATNTLDFTTTQSTGIINNGGTIASTGTNGADGGTILVNSSSGGGFEIGGTAATTVNNLKFVANATFYISGPSLKINGTFTIPDNNWAFNGSSKSPIYGTASTLYINKNNQGYSQGKEWSANSGTIGVTPGYPNNVILVNMGSSSGGTGGTGWVPTGAIGLNGALQVGDGTTNGRISLENVTSFDSGGLIVQNNSLIVGPATGVPFTNRGNFTLAGGTTGVFQSMGATINFDGTGTSASPQTISTTASAVTFTNMTVSNGTYVQLQSPVSITNNLNMTSGYVGTTTTNLLSINNTATTAITGGGNTAYVDGPLAWSIPATTTGTYIYPIGDLAHNGGAYLPLTLLPNTTSGAVATATAFHQNSGGTPGASVTSLSTTEYWSLTTSSPFTSSPLVNVTRPNAVAPTYNALAESSTASGVYEAIGGTPSSFSVSGGGIGTSSPAFIVIVKAPLSVVELSSKNYGCNGTLGALTAGGSGGTAPYQFKIDGGSYQASGVFDPLTAGDHVVTVMDATTTTATATLKVLGSVVINGNDQDVITCPPASTTLKATNLQNTTPVFTWSLNASGTPVLFTGANYTVSPSTGTYTYYVTSQLYNTNLLVNGNFESGNTGFTSSYQYYTGAQYATTPGNNGYYSISNAGTNQCQYFTILSGGVGPSLGQQNGGNSYFIGDGATASSLVWSQTVSGLTVGTVYKFQFYYAAADPDATHAQLRTDISGIASPGTITTTDATAWTQVSYSFTATSTSHTFSLTNLTATGSTNGNDFYLDNMELLQPCTVSASVIVRADCTLPVELTDFNANRQGSGALLTWGTALEINSAYFTVEKSQDGTTFESVGQVKASGNSSTVHRYSFVDPSIAAGVTYYRLAQYDVDGAVHYSSIKMVYKEGLGDVQVVPNPSYGNFVVTLDQMGEVKSTLVVVNMLGQIVYEGAEETGNIRSVDISHLASGSYYLQVSTAQKTVVKKIVKE